MHDNNIPELYLWKSITTFRSFNIKYSAFIREPVIAGIKCKFMIFLELGDSLRRTLVGKLEFWSSKSVLNSGMRIRKEYTEITFRKFRKIRHKLQAMRIIFIAQLMITSNNSFCLLAVFFEQGMKFANYKKITPPHGKFGTYR